jgi:hypothetical protein
MAGHWYDKKGNPQHFVQGKNGERRDATLRDARKHHWAPGFSGVTSVMAKPGLTAWFENQLLEAAWEVAPPSTEDDARYQVWKTDVKTAARERSLKARDRGSEIHDAIEHFIKDEKWNYTEFGSYVENVDLAIQDAFSLDLKGLEAETTFSSSLGYGGMIDGLRRSEPLLLDWKTKDKEWTDKTKLVFDEHGMQLAAYRHGVGLESAVCANVFISPSAKIKIHIWEEDELQRLFEKFKTCLTLWQQDRKYDSGWTE